MRDWLLVVWDDFSSFRRRNRSACRWLLPAATISTVLLILSAGTAFRSSPGDPVMTGPTLKGSAGAASSTPAPSLPRGTRDVGHLRPATRSWASERPLKGKELAIAWLTGFLTRSDRSDERWIAAVRNLTTPELLEALRTEGPSAVGLDQLASWRVVRIKPINAIQQPVDTESRTVLSYAATVADDYTEIEKPFQLYCYRGAHGRWLVASIEQPYSSEG